MYLKVKKKFILFVTIHLPLFMIQVIIMMKVFNKILLLLTSVRDRTSLNVVKWMAEPIIFADFGALRESCC